MASARSTPVVARPRAMLNGIVSSRVESLSRWKAANEKWLGGKTISSLDATMNRRMGGEARITAAAIAYSWMRRRPTRTVQRLAHILLDVRVRVGEADVDVDEDGREDGQAVAQAESERHVPLHEKPPELVADPAVVGVDQDHRQREGAGPTDEREQKR